MCLPTWKKKSNVLLFNSALKKQTKKTKPKKLTFNLLPLIKLYLLLPYCLLTPPLPVLCIPVLWLRDYESNWHQCWFLLNWLHLSLSVIFSVSNQPNPGILKSIQRRLCACCTINVFHLSSFFFSFLSYRNSQKSPRRTNPARTGTNPLYIKHAILCWNYKCCAKRLFTFQNLRELNKGLCSHLSHCIMKIVKT